LLAFHCVQSPEASDDPQPQKFGYFALVRLIELDRDVKQETTIVEVLTEIGIGMIGTK